MSRKIRTVQVYGTQKVRTILLQKAGSAQLMHPNLPLKKYIPKVYKHDNETWGWK